MRWGSVVGCDVLKPFNNQGESSREHPSSRAVLNAIAIRWGSMADRDRAEAFQLIRAIQ